MSRKFLPVASHAEILRLVTRLRDKPKNVCVGGYLARGFVYLAASTARALGKGPLFLKRRRETCKR